MTTSVRTYPLPRAVAATVSRAPVAAGPAEFAVRAARRGRVCGFHLPLLASANWTAGAEWAAAVLDREKSASEAKRSALLASVGYDPETYVYQGVLDPGYPDHELIVSVARQEGYDAPLERWDGVDWGSVEVSPDGLEFVVLDADVLADVVDALGSGSAGLMLRPFEPRAWIRDAAPPMDYPVISSGYNPHETGVMVALPVDYDVARRISVGNVPAGDAHVTLAYLGDLTEDPIDFASVQRAVATWSRRMSELTGVISGPGTFTAGQDEPVAVALVDLPDLPTAREMLVKILESEGVKVKKDHGYTPHITIGYGHEFAGTDVSNIPLYFDQVGVYYGDETVHYPLGEPVVAAGGAGPDIFYAIVDEFDTTAVLDLIRVLPGPIAYRRSGGKWVKDNDVLLRLVGADPPPVVEVDPSQAEDVLAQVDSYDTKNPEKPKKPMAAAGMWTEDLHPREGGKFAKKSGPGQHQPAANTKAKMPQRPVEGRHVKGGSKRPPGDGRRRPPPSAKQIRRHSEELLKKPWLALELGNDKNHRDLDMGLGPEFWSRQKPGFRQWVVPWMNKMKGKSEYHLDDVPPKFLDSLNEFSKAAALKADQSGPGTGEIHYSEGEMFQRNPANFDAEGNRTNAGRPDQQPQWDDATERIKRLDKADRDWDLKFAQEGLGEARRREMFDRMLAGTNSRLTTAGVDPGRIQRVIRHKAQEERARRDAFERRRRTGAEQERVRRLRNRTRESDIQADTPVVADASAMPSKLKGYWLKGEGAAKIRWGTGGDFGRCTRALAKYLKPGQVKGACANLHHLATGKYPGKGKGH